MTFGESTDQTDTALLTIFVREVYCNFDIFEEVLSIALLKDRTTGEDIFKALKHVMEFNNLRFKSLRAMPQTNLNILV